MSLSTGARIGPYEIVGAIGAGGMGEVYRARDTQLNRQVAIKILPELFAAEVERLEDSIVRQHVAGGEHPLHAFHRACTTAYCNHRRGIGR